VNAIFEQFNQLIEDQKADHPNSSIFVPMCFSVDQNFIDDSLIPDAKNKLVPNEHSYLKIDLTDGDQAPLASNLLNSLRKKIDVIAIESQDGHQLLFTDLIKEFSKNKLAVQEITARGSIK
jgi:transcriptional antiterminator Rof (Rho-off)